MRIALATVGTTGDVRPFAILGVPSPIAATA